MCERNAVRHLSIEGRAARVPPGLTNVPNGIVHACVDALQPQQQRYYLHRGLYPFLPNPCHGGLQAPGVHDLELQRQRAAIEAIDKDVQEESKVNREIAELVSESLGNSRK